MHPKDKPLKNKANTLNGRGNKPNNTNEASATATERMMNFKRFSFFNSDITLIPISLARK